MKITEDEHEDHHDYVRTKKRKDEAWESQTSRMKWAIATTLITGLVISMVSLVWWAFGQFIKNGGAG